MTHVRRSTLHRRVLALSVALAAVSVSAQPVVPATITNGAGTNAQFGAWYFGGGFKAGTAGSNMSPAQNPAPAGPTNYSGWTKAGNYGAAPEATGITITQTGDVPTPGAKSPPKFTFRSFANAASVGAALSGFAAAAAVIQGGMAIYDLAKELGWNVDKNGPGGATRFQQIDPNAGWCTSATCYEWAVLNPAGAPYFKTPAAAAQWLIGKNNSDCGTRLVGTIVDIRVHPTVGYPAYQYSFTCTGQSSVIGYANFGSRTRAADTGPAPYLDRTAQDFADYIAAQSGWPQSSSVAKATRDAMDAGFKPTVGAPTVSGPATADGGKTTTTNPDGSRAETQKTVNYNYAGDTVTYNITNTTNYYNSSNVQTGSSTSTEDAAKPDEACSKSADSLGCTKFGTPVDQQLSSKDVPVTLSPVSFSSTASCPAPVPWTMALTGVSVSGAFSYQAACDLLTYIRPVVLTIAAAIAAFIFIGGLKS